MKKLSFILAGLLVASIAFAGNADPKARSRIADIQKGENNVNQIKTLRVLNGAIIGGGMAIAGGITNSGPLVASDGTFTNAIDVGGAADVRGNITTGANTNEVMQAMGANQLCGVGYGTNTQLITHSEVFSTTPFVVCSYAATNANAWVVDSNPTNMLLRGDSEDADALIHYIAIGAE